MADFAGTSGDDTLVGSNNADSFDVSQGGNDIVDGRGGDDTIYFGHALTAADHVNGAAGNDTVEVGNYSKLVFGANTLVSVETLVLGSGTFVMNDGNVAAGQTLTVNAGRQFVFSGAAETDGNYAITASDKARITGGAGDDTITLTGEAGRQNALHGGAGNDTLDANVANLATLDGGAGNDILIGAAVQKVFGGEPAGLPQSTFDISGGGRDMVTGGSGSDTIIAGAALLANDSINGGGGNDTLELDGNYTGKHALTLGTNLASIEKLTLAAGHSYDLTTGGEAPDIVANLGAGDTLTVNASSDTDGIAISSSAGTNILTGSATAADTFTLQALLPEDRIAGGGGNDTLTLLTGTQTKAVFGQHTIGSIEKIILSSGSSYNFQTSDGNVPGGHTLTVDASHLNAGDSFRFDGRAETNGNFVFMTGAGHDTIYAGGGNDVFHIEGALNAIASGGDGDDTFYLGATLAADTQVHGGAGSDTLFLDGNYFDKVALGTETVRTIDTISLAGGNDYNFTSSNATVAAQATMTVDAHQLGAGDRLTFNGAAETNGHFVFDSGSGADILTGGGLKDTFVYDDGITLSGATRDTLHSFDFSNDIVQFAAVTGIDSAVAAGSASKGSIDGDLTAIFGSGQTHELGAHHAVLFTADGGDLSGKTFLIVDGDGVAGYTAGQDLVIRLTDALHTGDIGTGNFTT